MTNQVKVTLASDSKEVQRAMEQMNSQVDKATTKLENLRNKSRKSTDEGKRGFDAKTAAIGRMVTRIGSAAAYVSLQSAVRLLGDEFEATKRKQQAFLDATLEPAEALAKVKINFVPDATLSKKDFEDEVFKLSKEINQPVAQVAGSLSGVLSAKGDLTNRQAFELVRQTGRLGIFDPDFNRQMAESAGDIAKNQGDFDPRALLGSLINQQSAARVTQLDKLGKNLLPGIIGLTNFGFSYERSAELAATLTQLSGDSEGQQTGTALPGLGQKLVDFIPQRATTGRFKGQFVGEDARGQFAIPDTQVEEYARTIAESPDDIFGVLQRSPELARAFEKELQGALRANVRQPVVKLVRGAQEALDVDANSQRIIQDLPGLENQFEDQVDFQKSGRLTKIAEAQREAAVAKEQALLGNDINQRIAAARQKFEETLDLVDLVGADTPQRKAVTIGLEKALKRVAAEGGSPELEAAKALQVFPQEAGPLSLFSSDMTPEDRREIGRAVNSLQRRARDFGPVESAIERQPEITQQMEAGTNRLADHFGFDDEMRGLMRRVAESNERIMQQGEAETRPPRQTVRPSQFLSRPPTP